MNRSRSRSLIAVGIATATLAGCSGGSSSGTPIGGASATTAAIDRTDVDAALNHVLTGLRRISAPGTTVPATVASLRTGATELAAGAAGLSPAPTGVPSTLADGIHTGLLNESGLMTQAADCLDQQTARAHPSTVSCAAPLQKADKATSALAHALISLSAYGTSSPTAFETDLVAALHGT